MGTFNVTVIGDGGIELQQRERQEHRPLHSRPAPTAKAIPVAVQVNPTTLRIRALKAKYRRQKRCSLCGAKPLATVTMCQRCRDRSNASYRRRYPRGHWHVRPKALTARQRRFLAVSGLSAADGWFRPVAGAQP